MTSGAKVADQVKELFKIMKVPKKHETPNRLRLAIFEIKDGYIDLEKDKLFNQERLDQEDDVFQFFISQLDSTQCRFLLYDCHYQTKETGKKEDLVFIMWTPGTAAIKDKMNYASSNRTLMDALRGVKHTLQINDYVDINTRRAFAEKLGQDAISIEGKALSD